MGVIPIGEAAARLGMTASALRYYDERRLVCPKQRLAGRRMYGVYELRRLALIKIFNQLGVSLDTAAAVLDSPGPRWREVVRRQIARLDEVIAQAQGASTRGRARRRPAPVLADLTVTAPYPRPCHRGPHDQHEYARDHQVPRPRTQYVQ
jgi:DNA-binding transcriptional MerR regulator